MSKWAGKIGFAVSSEVRPGVWKDIIIERSYKGDERRISRRLVTSDSVVDSPTISNEISILADAFAFENFQMIRYIVWHNHKWKVKTITVESPRLTLEIGDEYNGVNGPEVETS